MGIKELVAKIEDLATKATGPILIAIDGRSASGKTTLASQFADSIQCTVVHMDDFYRAMSPIEAETLTPAQGADSCFDWQRLRSEVLEPLLAGKSVSSASYDWENQKLGGMKHYADGDVVLLEGVYSNRPELSNLVDYSILVQVDEWIRKQRQAERNDSTEWQARWNAAEDMYFANPPAFDALVQGI